MPSRSASGVETSKAEAALAAVMAARMVCPRASPAASTHGAGDEFVGAMRAGDLDRDGGQRKGLA
ncbi:hypothetical protein, partial [Mesorhizobium sp. M7A.F.Ca.CA.001.14.1.1]|uniref:hypothetical protein n=1 Tax=Mesorhizobium sp. M7A.F.Ca.CA.001.14.1.1 TaxID=2496706 RepID=UPI0019D4DD38